MEFEEQGGRQFQCQPSMAVGCLDGYFIEEFDAGDRDAALDRRNDGFHRAAHRLEGADGRGDGFRDRVQLDGHLGDHAERAFGADIKLGEVVAGRGFFVRRPVVMILPCGVTTRSAKTFSRIVP